jgi:hypothetical protein
MNPIRRPVSDWIRRQAHGLASETSGAPTSDEARRAGPGLAEAAPDQAFMPPWSFEQPVNLHPEPLPTPPELPARKQRPRVVRVLRRRLPFLFGAQKRPAAGATDRPRPAQPQAIQTMTDCAEDRPNVWANFLS